MGDRRDYWRDPTKYPDAESTSLHRWAFEFLMRNPKYLREWDEALNWQKAQLEAGASPLETVKRIDALRARWGINSFHNWDEEHPLDTATQFDRAPRRTVAVSTRDDRVRLEFDLDKPVDPQIERARHTLNAEQQKRFPHFKRKRNQVQKFPIYLRVLDAIAAGASLEEMLKVFAYENDNVDERTVSHWNTRATKLRDGGYRDLIAQ
jgi:hypothetical protein